MIAAGVLVAYAATKGGMYWVRLAISTLFVFGFPIEFFRTARKPKRFWFWFAALLIVHLVCCYALDLPKSRWRSKEIMFLLVVEASALTAVLSWLSGGLLSSPTQYPSNQRTHN